MEKLDAGGNVINGRAQPDIFAAVAFIATDEKQGADAFPGPEDEIPDALKKNRVNLIEPVIFVSFV